MFIMRPKTTTEIKDAMFKAEDSCLPWRDDSRKVPVIFTAKQLRILEHIVFNFEPQNKEVQDIRQILLNTYRAEKIPGDQFAAPLFSEQ